MSKLGENRMDASWDEYQEGKTEPRRATYDIDEDDPLQGLRYDHIARMQAKAAKRKEEL